MAVKITAQKLGQATIDENREITIDVHMVALDNGNNGTVQWGPMAPADFTEANLAAFAKEYCNTYFSADAGLLDTVRIIDGIGGLLQ